jgi:glycosyltransferase involved in cell wall biosynthesis
MSKSALYNKPDQYRSGLKISLVTPVLNQAEFIGQAIESVLSQEFPALEYIVMDGGSKDGTIRIIEKYRDHLTYCESAEDGGQSEAINKGFSYASGDILAWLNADDLLLPGTLDYIANFFAMNPSIDVVYGNRIVINAEGKDIGRWILPPHSNRILSWIDYVPQETLFWRRNIWDRVGGNVDTSFQFAMDWDLLVRFRECGACFFHLPIYIGAFRVHPSQKTHSQMNEIGLREMNKIRNRCLGYIPSKMAIRFAVMPYVIRHIICNWRDRLDQPFDCKTLKLLDLN